MAAKVSEALMLNDEQRILLALNDTDTMNTLATEVKAIVKDLIKEGQFDIEIEEHRAEVKRIGRRIGRTAKDIDDCGIAYLRDTKAKIKLVEDRKKWFRDELAIVRASVEKPVTEWEAKREEADNAIAWLNLQKTASVGMGLEQLTISYNAIMTHPSVKAPEKQEAFFEALSSAKDCIIGRIEAVKLAAKQTEELEALRKEKADRDKAELDRLRNVVAKLPEMPQATIAVPVADPAEQLSVSMINASSSKFTAAVLENQMNSVRMNEIKCLCIDLYNEFANGDAYFTGEMRRLELIPGEDPF